MNELTFEIESNQEIWELIDKRINHVFIHKFNPHEVIEWWKTDLKINDGIELKGIAVRDMNFDVQTDLNGLKQILNLDTRQLRVYQFEKPVPDTLTLEHLPENSKHQILKQNGMQHFFWIDFEFISISSFDFEYLKSIEENPKFSERIQRRRNPVQQNL